MRHSNSQQMVLNFIEQYQGENQRPPTIREIQDHCGFKSPRAVSYILEKLEELAPHGRPYKHHATGEDNGDAHLKRQLLGQQVVLAVTAGRLDFGPWEQVQYAEFDGRRAKRVIVKIIGA